MRNKIVAAALLGLLIAAGLVFIGCDTEKCPGNGDCTVTIEQGVGLYVDNDAPRSSCGKSRKYNYDTGSYDNGCKVQDNIDGYNRTYGSKGCDC